MLTTSCSITVLIIFDLAQGHGWGDRLNFCPGAHGGSW